MLPPLLLLLLKGAQRPEAGRTERCRGYLTRPKTWPRVHGQNTRTTCCGGWWPRRRRRVSRGITCGSSSGTACPSGTANSVASAGSTTSTPASKKDRGRKRRSNCWTRFTRSEPTGAHLLGLTDEKALTLAQVRAVWVRSDHSARNAWSCVTAGWATNGRKSPGRCLGAPTMRAKTTGTLRTGAGDRSDRALTTMSPKSRTKPARLRPLRAVTRIHRSRRNHRIQVPTHTHGSQNQTARAERRSDERHPGHCLSHRRFQYAARSLPSLLRAAVDSVIHRCCGVHHRLLKLCPSCSRRLQHWTRNCGESRRCGSIRSAYLAARASTSMLPV